MESCILLLPGPCLATTVCLGKADSSVMITFLVVGVWWWWWEVIRSEQRKSALCLPNACACSLSQYSDENMMDPYNLAICFGPTLMHIPDGQDPVSCQAHVNEVIKTIIINHEGIFPSHRELEGPVYEKCMTGGEEYW